MTVEPTEQHAMTAPDSSLIDQYDAAGPALRPAIAGLSREDLLAHPVPGTWSIQEVVIHLADSDGIGIDRMKRMIAEERPLLIGYDETKFAQRLCYADQSAADAVELFDLNRRQFARVLRQLPRDAWARPGVHSERGLVTLGGALPHYVHHFEHHLKFIREKRAKLGKAPT